jgi:hypothetical protein
MKRLVIILCLLLPSVAGASMDSVKVYGLCRDGTDTPVQGAEITAVRSNPMNAVDTTSSDTTFIIVPDPVTAKSDSLGYWFLYLRQTAAFVDSQFYNISGNAWGGEFFKILRLTIPDVDSMNLGDSLAGR